MMKLLTQKGNALFLIFILNLSLMLSACATKVTDPSDPRFDVSQFRFEDYIGEQGRKDIKTLFPVGTSKSFVDDVLISYGGAKIHKREYFHQYEPETKQFKKITGENIFHYYYARPRRSPYGTYWKVDAYYDESNNLEIIKFRSGAMRPLPIYSFLFF